MVFGGGKDINITNFRVNSIIACFHIHFSILPFETSRSHVGPREDHHDREGAGDEHLHPRGREPGDAYLSTLEARGLEKTFTAGGLGPGDEHIHPKGRGPEEDNHDRKGPGDEHLHPRDHGPGDEYLHSKGQEGLKKTATTEGLETCISNPEG
ncbi:unnamed protein product [Cuscuta europaea]|uniref:Uncharacterized protein n=1 Tax=Cuscuta europaea TaxID=41803 RepID=A0A9P1E6W6_CUSEU|nr:unnamed protein product [Cuscuta europaea]